MAYIVMALFHMTAENISAGPSRLRNVMNNSNSIHISQAYIRGRRCHCNTPSANNWLSLGIQPLPLVVNGSGGDSGR